MNFRILNGFKPAFNGSGLGILSSPCFRSDKRKGEVGLGARSIIKTLNPRGVSGSVAGLTELRSGNRLSELACLVCLELGSKTFHQLTHSKIH